MFPEFNSNEKANFYLFKFHQTFDGLIGLDNLKLLQAKLDLPASLLITKNATLPIEYYETIKTQFYSIQLAPNTVSRVRLPVKEAQGTILLPKQELQGAQINDTLTSACNQLAWTEIINTTDEELQIALTSPVTSTKLDLDQFHIYTTDIISQESPSPDGKMPEIRTNHLNSEEEKAIQNVCKKYADIFHYPDMSLTFTNQIKHNIRTKDEVPVYTKSYRYPHIHKEEVKNQISSMLDQGIIRPSQSPWSSPIWIVPKKPDASGKIKWRIVVDYRKVNEKTIDDKYPIPNITDILDKLGRCQYFTTLDLASGFHQIEMAKEDICKTAFNVENGHYEYIRMPFGLKNAPATFQRVMDNVLKGLQGENCLVYMDDIIVFSTSLQEHLVYLSKIFQRLRETGFKIQMDKCEFLKKEVAFLGHIVTPEGIRPNPAKIKAILDYPIPRTTKEIRGFLGLLGYYRKFIKDFAKITKPLTSCLKKDAKIELTPEFLNCIRTCKNLLTNQPLLQYPDFNKPFNLTTDASNYAIGAILSQGPIGSDKPIAYASRTLNETELRYSTIEKEMLAIIWATKYFRPYLFGRKFKILSDHRPLQWLFSMKDNNSKIVRWRLKLEEFDYEIIYKKGKSNTNADALSRVEIHTKEIARPPQDEDNASLYNNAESILDIDEVLEKPASQTKIQEVISEILDNPNPEEDNETRHTAQEEPILGIPISERALNYYNNQIVLKSVNYNPAKPMMEVAFPNKSRLHVQISKNNLEGSFIKLLKEEIDPKKKYAIFFKDEDLYVPLCNILQRTFKNSAFDLIKCNLLLEDINSEERQSEIIQAYHQGKTNHRGINETEAQIRKRYYWPNLKRDIENIINICDTCQSNKYDRNPAKPRFMITPTPTRPLEIIHLDTFQAGGQTFLTIIDSFSKYGQAYPIEGSNSVNVLNALLIFMTHHGIPQMIVTDSGTEFKNGLVQEFLDTHKIAIHYTTPDNPQSNGTIERFHSTIIEHLRILRENKKSLNIKEQMPYALLGYNNSIHSMTNMRPMDILTGHLDAQDPFDVDVRKTLINNYTQQHREKTKTIYKKLNQKLHESKEKYIGKRNITRQTPLTYKPSTKIYTRKTVKRNKLLPRFSPKTINTDNIVTIDTQDTTIHKKNIKNLPRNNSRNSLQMFLSHRSEPPDPGPERQPRNNSPQAGTSKDS